MKWKPYPAYKDSGVEWLGEVPTHWVIERFKRSVLYSRNGVWGDEALGDDNDIPCVRVADFDRQKLSVILDEPTIRNVLPKDRVGRQLNFGNLLLEKSGGGENQPVGCVVLYEDTKPAVCSNFVAKVELEDGMCPSFWRYMHATAYSIRLTVGSINQTSGIQNLDQGRYFDERACFPPASEQTAIATFLDRETAKLDTLISKQERLIELLQEKRQTIISHAVTKGLDPDVPMKDSGIEWLGEVPAHWKINRTKFLFEIVKIISGSNEHKVLSITQSGIKVKDIESGEGQLSDDYSKYQFVEIGDFAMNHMDLLTGYVDISKFDGVTSPDYRVFRIRDKTSSLSEYFLHLFQFAYKRKIYYNLGQGVSNLGRWRLPTDEFNNFKLPLPPLAEQVEICQYLGIQTNKINLLIDKARQSIDLAKEHRSALISAAVTGKIDVREAA